MNEKKRSVAIDGPSGAGKSTLARRAAEKFRFIYVDTGAIYRTLGFAVKKSGIGSKDQKGVSALLPAIRIDICHDEEGTQRMILNGSDVSGEIRTPEISIYASDVSAMPQVRKYLLDMQRDIALRYDVIMDGRDIGTVVLPDADLKIFLTADVRDRARRRYLELLEKGVDTSLDEVLRDIEYRDKNDSARECAPLCAALGAVTLDTTGNSLESSIGLICSLIEEKLGI